MQNQHHVPTVVEYARAFRALEPTMTPNQRQLLVVHHAAQARVMTASLLAERLGFESYDAVNLQYGMLARQVADQLGIDVGDIKIGILVDFVSPGQTGNEHHLWVMRQNVAEAIEALGWVPPVSHLLYPHLAIAEAPATA
jgi:hypothetical protein